MVIIMDKIIVTNIEEPFTVNSEKGKRIDMVHRNSYGISFCLCGQITYTMNGKEFVSTKDNAVLLPKNGTYSLHGDKEGLFPLINFDCEGFKLEEILVVPLDEPIASINGFDRIKELFLKKESHYKIYGAFYEMLDRIFCEKSKSNPLLSVIRYIEENLSDPELTNKKIANQKGISEVYLRKLFIASFNTTPKQYVIDLRIKKAKSMLIDTPYSVTAISEICGFSSLYHFCRAFKEKTGTTPSEYAKYNKRFEI